MAPPRGGAPPGRGGKGFLRTPPGASGGVPAGWLDPSPRGGVQLDGGWAWLVPEDSQPQILHLKVTEHLKDCIIFFVQEREKTLYRIWRSNKMTDRPWAIRATGGHLSHFDQVPMFKIVTSEAGRGDPQPRGGIRVILGESRRGFSLAIFWGSQFAHQEPRGSPLPHPFRFPDEVFQGAHYRSEEEGQPEAQRRHHGPPHVGVHPAAVPAAAGPHQHRGQPQPASSGCGLTSCPHAKRGGAGVPT